MLRVCRLFSSLHAREQPAFARLAVTLMLLAGACYAGCGKRPPPVTDPAKAPWLLDPQSQINGLKNGDFRIRGISAFNLGNMGAKAADALPELERLARDDQNQKVRVQAREAVDKIRAATGKTTQ